MRIIAAGKSRPKCQLTQAGGADGADGCVRRSWPWPLHDPSPAHTLIVAGFV